jgi:uncharacterized OB-fold protein
MSELKKYVRIKGSEMTDIEMKACATCGQFFHPRNRTHLYCKNPCKGPLTQAEKWLQHKPKRKLPAKALSYRF